MSNVAFEVNPYAIAFGAFDKKIIEVYTVKKHPEMAEYYRKLGQRDTAWDRILTEFIRKNPSVFKDPRLINPKGNMFRDLTSHAVLSGKDNFRQRVEAIMRYQYDISEEEIEKVTNILPKIDSLMETNEFKQIYDTTRKYRNQMEREWNSSKHLIGRYFANLLGFDIPDNDRKVVTLVMPPISSNQRNYPIDSNRVLFFWSQPEKIKKQSKASEITSIAHAKLHHALPYKPTMTSDKKKMHHAFVKFATDKELYSKITGKSYLDNDSKDEDGKIMGQVYPYWLGYLHRNDDNPAREIRKDIQRDREAFNRLESNARKRKLYSSYNFERLSPEKIAAFFRYRKGIRPYEFNEIDFENIADVYKDEYLETAKDRKTKQRTLENR